MKFKNVHLETGDFVSFQTKIVPLPEVQAAVLDVKDGALIVMSTVLAPFETGGKFTEEQIDRIKVVYPANVAIKQESNGKLSNHQRVYCIAEGDTHYGEIIAAFDGVAVMLKDNGEFIHGGVSHFYEDY